MFNLLHFGDKWKEFVDALPCRLAEDTRQLILDVFSHHAASLESSGALTLRHRKAQAICHRVLKPLRCLVRERVTIQEIELPKVEWEVQSFHGWLASDPTTERQRDLRRNDRIFRYLDQWDWGWLTKPGAIAFERALQRVVDERKGVGDADMMRRVVHMETLGTALASAGDHYLLLQPGGLVRWFTVEEVARSLHVPPRSAAMQCISEGGGLTELQAVEALGEAVHVGVGRAWVKRLISQGRLRGPILRYGSACSGALDTVAASVAAEIEGRLQFEFASEIKAKRCAALSYGWASAGLMRERCHSDARCPPATTESRVDFWSLTSSCQAYSDRNHNASDEDARESLVDVYQSLDYVRLRSPDVVFVENVASARVVRPLSAMLSALVQYEWEMCVCDALDVGGGPTARKRCYWVGRLRLDAAGPST